MSILNLLIPKLLKTLPQNSPTDYHLFNLFFFKVCAQKRAKYALGEPKLDVKDMYVKDILSHLLADAEDRSLVSDSFPKMHINDKINISVKAMYSVAAKKLLNKALQICREHAGSLLQAARLVQSMELTDKNHFSDGCHMASTEPSFYDSAYKLVKREYATIVIHTSIQSMDD